MTTYLVDPQTHHQLNETNIDRLFRARPAPADGAIEIVSNDYLDLGAHPAIASAQCESSMRTGNGNRMAAPHIPPHDPQHVLERRIADWLGVEAVLITQSGWTANYGLMSVLGRERRVYIDACAHSSLTDGAIGGAATIHTFGHNDPQSLDDLLTAQGPGLVVINALYNIWGDIPPLAEIVEVAERHDCPIAMDESHSLGAMGPGGRGLAEELGLADRIAYRTSSLAKAFVARGGLIATTRADADRIRYGARSACFASTLLPHDIAGIDAALTIISGEEGRMRRSRLDEVTRQLVPAISAQGWKIGAARNHIISLDFPSVDLLADAVYALDEAEIRTAAFILPQPKPGPLPLRLCLRAGLTRTDLDRIASATALLSPARTGV